MKTNCKRLQTVLFTSLLLLGFCAAKAQTFTVDGINYSILSGESEDTLSVEVKQGNYSGEIVIPDSVNYEGKNYAVKSISQYGFTECSDLVSVIIPKTVTTIGRRVFNNCTGLTNITIPNSVTSIGDHVFSNCPSLTSIIVEEGNSVYDSRNNCNAIIETESNKLIAGCKSTTIPNLVTSIEAGAFSSCTSLISLILPNTVTSIGRNAFQGCSSLTNINIPNSVTSIGNSAFYNCSSLTSLTIPNSVTSIGNNAFYNCSSCLKSITIEEGNSVYDSRDNCNALIVTSSNQLILGCQSTIIPNTVTSIGENAFQGCSSLTNITIPNSVTSIGNSAFYNCSSLTSLTFSNSVTSVEVNAFGECPNLETVYCYANYLSGNMIFTQSYIKTATLYVPYHQIEEYKASGVRAWGAFGTILPITHKVTYVVDGQEYATDSVYYNASITPMDEPTAKEGYTFSGWSEIPETMPAHDLTITGSFESNSIDEVMTDAKADVYNLQGIKVQEQISLRELGNILPAGIYIYNGKKIVVK